MEQAAKVYQHLFRREEKPDVRKPTAIKPAAVFYAGNREVKQAEQPDVRQALAPEASQIVYDLPPLVKKWKGTVDFYLRGASPRVQTRQELHKK